MDWIQPLLKLKMGFRNLDMVKTVNCSSGRSVQYYLILLTSYDMQPRLAPASVHSALPNPASPCPTMLCPVLQVVLVMKLQ